MSLSVDYTVYRKEVINFLQTVSIKFDLFAEQSQLNAESNIKTMHLSDLDGRNNPYYLNLAGQYSALDEEIKIIPIEEPYVLDDDGNLVLDSDGNKIVNEVVFSRETLEKYPKTAGIYKIPNIEYENLLLKHKGKEGLIKSIVYPAKDIDTVLNARNLSVLAYDSSLLEQDERDSLILAMNNFLDYVYDRWYVHDFKYEPAYAITFMGMIWDLLPSVLFAQRIRNLRTAQVHSMHIWEYLDSKGLGEYKAILTRKQSVFLYRNIDYILHNKGKKTNLDILAENLLEELHLSLVGKSILQETHSNNNIESGRFNTCTTYPEFVSDSITDWNDTSEEVLDEDTKQSMQEILHRMHKEGYYPDYLNPDGSVNTIHIQEMEQKFGLSTFNYLPTRLLEFKKAVINTSNLKFLSEFLVDSLMYQWANGALVYNIKFLDKNINQQITLNVGDTIALLYYAHHKAHGYTPIYLPVRYTSRICYYNKKPRKLPTTFSFNNYTYLLSSIINTNSILKDITFDDGPYTYIDKFMNMLATQFGALSKHNNQMKANVNPIYQRAMEYFYSHITVRETFDLLLSSHFNYKSWLNSNEDLTLFIEEYDKLEHSKECYQNLCDVLWNQLLPIDTLSIFSDFTGGQKDNTYIYEGMKKLFTQLCSYRLFFLETDRTSISFLTPPFDNLGIYSAIDTDYTSVPFAIDSVTTELIEMNDGHLSIDVDFFDKAIVEQDATNIDIVPATEDTSYYEDRSITSLTIGVPTFIISPIN